MKNNIIFLIQLIIAFLPFLLFAFLNSKCNVKKKSRNRQYPMPVIAIVYCGLLFYFLDTLSNLCIKLILWLADLMDQINLPAVGDFIRNIYTSLGMFLIIIVFNTLAMLVYIIVKRFLTLIFGAIKVKPDSFVGGISEIFYTYEESEGRWYIKEHFGQARTFLKTAYYGCCAISGSVVLASFSLCLNNMISSPVYPAFAVIILGELVFFIDGIGIDEKKSELAIQTDKSRRVTLYPLLRKPLKALFGDKLSAEGTTINNGGMSGGSVEDILAGIEATGGHLGKNYAMFIRKKMENGLKPNADYVRSGYDLAMGKSLLFNTPFYDKLNPYIFYAINRRLLMGEKILIVLGRHGTENDLKEWSEQGMRSVSNIPDLWKVSVLSSEKQTDDNMPDIGIISRSGVHNLDIHKNNLMFLHKVSLVVVIEPSKLVTTAQIGLNLLIKSCEKENITFCSIDRNCDGLVDALSHILMTNITEVTATEYPHGMSSYMYWTADDEYLQHRMLPGISRFLGMGTELSMVALKNQVKKAVWYGGEAFPVLDAHWIAKQYYYDLLDYANLPTNQEIFDKQFCASFNMCNERVSDYSYITVEDDRNNLFETRRNFATIAEQQGFINVISSEYMLREYMSSNPEIFTADPKAIPYITADYAYTKRNAILSICLLLCIDSVKKETMIKQLSMLNMNTENPALEIWKEICFVFGSEDNDLDKQGNPILKITRPNGKSISFEMNNTILFKRAYNMEKGKFESVYTIEDKNFSNTLLDDLQNAGYIAEHEKENVYIGTELKGHVYQKYMPGQMFTLNGKYYEMLSATADNRIMIRRASEYIDGRLSYRQIREYSISRLTNSLTMGHLKSVNNIDIHYQFADFNVKTHGYWKLHAYNDFDNGQLVRVNGIPVREYHHKQILRLDFSNFGEAFTDSIRMTLTNLLNEVFVTLFAENKAFISAVTPGNYNAPLTYSLSVDETIENVNSSIFIIEDSQLDIGLLIAVERNLDRILQIISDYLSWNNEQILESLRKENAPVEQEKPEKPGIFEEAAKSQNKEGFFRRIINKIKALFAKFKGKKKDTPENADGETGNLTPKELKKAAKEAKKAEKKAAKEARQAEKQAEKEKKAAEKAEKKTAKEDLKKQKQEEKLRKKQEKEEKKSTADPDKEPDADEENHIDSSDTDAYENTETIDEEAEKDEEEIKRDNPGTTTEISSDEDSSDEEVSEDE